MGGTTSEEAKQQEILAEMERQRQQQLEDEQREQQLQAQWEEQHRHEQQQQQLQNRVGVYDEFDPAVDAELEFARPGHSRSNSRRGVGDIPIDERSEGSDLSFLADFRGSNNTLFSGAGGAGAGGSKRPSLGASLRGDRGAFGGSSASALGGGGGGGGGVTGLNAASLAVVQGVSSQQLRQACGDLRALLRNASRELTVEERTALRELFDVLPHELLTSANNDQQHNRERVINMWFGAVMIKDFEDKFYIEFEKLGNNMQGALFASTDIRQQSRALINMISRAMKVLHDPAELQSMLRCLGAKHGMYGVDQRHYNFMGSALTRALQHTLKDKFTQELQIEWSRVYNHLANTLVAASKEHATAMAQSAQFKRKAVQTYLTNFARHVARLISSVQSSSRKKQQQQQAAAAQQQQQQPPPGAAPANPHQHHQRQQSRASSLNSGHSGQSGTAAGGLTSPSASSAAPGTVARNHDAATTLCELWLKLARFAQPNSYWKAAPQPQQVVMSAATAATESLARFLTDVVDDALQAIDVDILVRGASACAPALLLWARVSGSAAPEYVITKSICAAFSLVMQQPAAAAQFVAQHTTSGGGGAGASAACSPAATMQLQGLLQQSANTGDQNIAWVEKHIAQGLLSGLQRLLTAHPFAPLATPFAACALRIEGLQGLVLRNPRTLSEILDEMRVIRNECALLNRCHRIGRGEPGAHLINQQGVRNDGLTPVLAGRTNSFSPTAVLLSNQNAAAGNTNNINNIDKDCCNIGGGSGGEGSCLFYVAAHITQVVAFALQLQLQLHMAVSARPPLDTQGMDFIGRGDTFRRDVPRVAIAVQWCTNNNNTSSNNSSNVGLFATPAMTTTTVAVSTAAHATEPFQYLGSTMNELGSVVMAAAGGQILATAAAAQRLEVERRMFHDSSNIVPANVHSSPGGGRGGRPQQLKLINHQQNQQQQKQQAVVVAVPLCSEASASAPALLDFSSFTVTQVESSTNIIPFLVSSSGMLLGEAHSPALTPMNLPAETNSSGSAAGGGGGDASSESSANRSRSNAAANTRTPTPSGVVNHNNIGSSTHDGSLGLSPSQQPPRFSTSANLTHTSSHLNQHHHQNNNNRSQQLLHPAIYEIALKQFSDRKFGVGRHPTSSSSAHALLPPGSMDQSGLQAVAAAYAAHGMHMVRGAFSDSHKINPLMHSE